MRKYLKGRRMLRLLAKRIFAAGSAIYVANDIQTKSIANRRIEELHQKLNDLRNKRV